MAKRKLILPEPLKYDGFDYAKGEACSYTMSEWRMIQKQVLDGGGTRRAVWGETHLRDVVKVDGKEFVTMAYECYAVIPK